MKNSNTQEVKNPRLVMAMRAVANQNSAANLSRMAEALMDARLLSPIRSETVLMEKSGPSTRIKFEEIKNVEGDSYYLAFTDMNEYNKWNQDGSHDKALIMNIENYGDILIRNVNDLKGFVINPYGENISISKELLLSLLKQREIHERKSSQAN